MHTHKLSIQDALPFILGGKALFTIKNIKTETRFTYKVTIPNDAKPEDAPVYFVKVLTHVGDEESYKYIGFIKAGGFHQFHYGGKSKVSSSAQSVVAFTHVFNKLVVFGIKHPDLEIWHEGKCCRCGRTLTVPESIESGIGPECARISARQSKHQKAAA